MLTAISRYNAVKIGRLVSKHLLALASTQEISSYSTMKKAASSSQYLYLSTKLNEAIFGKTVILKKKNENRGFRMIPAFVRHEVSRTTQNTAH